MKASSEAEILRKIRLNVIRYFFPPPHAEEIPAGMISMRYRLQYSDDFISRIASACQYHDAYDFICVKFFITSRRALKCTTRVKSKCRFPA